MTGCVVVFFLCLACVVGGYLIGFIIGRQQGFVAGLQDNNWREFKRDFEKLHDSPEARELRKELGVPDLEL